MSVIVLAGGHSRRMGVDKALLQARGQPLLARVVGRLAGLSDDVIVSTDQAGRYTAALDGLGVTEVIDALPDAGPLSGLCAGLTAARYAQVVAVACDMPFVNAALLRWMAEQLPGYDAVVPQTGDLAHVGDPAHARALRTKSAGLHPLHAIYCKSCLETIHAALDEGERSMGGLLSRLNARRVGIDDLRAVDPRLLSLRNVNTPEDWAECLRLIENE